MTTVPYCEGMVRGCQCGIGGGGLGLCRHGMGAGRLCRPGVRLYGIGDKSADFRCFFSGTVGESVHMCTAGEGYLWTQRTPTSVLRPLLDNIELR